MGGISISAVLRVAVCEDDDDDRKRILTIISSSGYPTETASFNGGTALLNAFERGQYHIIFLDIYMPDISGVEVARAIRSKDEKVTLAFITASSDFTREGYRLGALKYIEKPFTPSDIKAALDLAWQLQQNRQVCTLITKQGKQEVALSDIRYVEVSNHVCTLYLEADQVQTHMNIESLAQLLPPPGFVRCHRSYIVNLAHVQAVDRDFIMTGGDRVYIRGKDQKKMENLYVRYLAAKTRRMGDDS